MCQVSRGNRAVVASTADARRVVEGQGQTKNLDTTLRLEHHPMSVLMHLHRRAGPPVQTLWLFADCKGTVCHQQEPRPKRCLGTKRLLRGRGRELPSTRRCMGIHLCGGRSYVHLSQKGQQQIETYIAPSKISLRRNNEITTCITPTNPTTCHCPDESVRAVPRPPDIGPYQTKHNERAALRTAQSRAKSTGKRYRLIDENGNLLDLVYPYVLLGTSLRCRYLIPPFSTPQTFTRRHNA